MALLAVARACAHSPEKQNTKLRGQFLLSDLLACLTLYCLSVQGHYRYLDVYKTRFSYSLIMFKKATKI